MLKQVEQEDGQPKIKHFPSLRRSRWFIVFLVLLIGLYFGINGTALMRLKSGKLYPGSLGESWMNIGYGSICNYTGSTQNGSAGAKIEMAPVGEEDEYEGLVGPEFDGVWWDAMETIWPVIKRFDYFDGVNDLRLLRERAVLKPLGHTLSFCSRNLSRNEGDDMSGTQFANADKLPRLQNISSMLQLPVGQVCIVMVRHSLRLIDTIWKPRTNSTQPTEPRTVMIGGEARLPSELRWTHHDVMDEEEFRLEVYSMPILVAVKNAFVSSEGHVYNDQIGTIWLKGCFGHPLSPGTNVEKSLWYGKVFVTSHGRSGGLYHELVEKFTRIAAFYGDLMSDPSIKVHVVPDRYGIVFKLLPMVRISLDRVIMGDVFADIAYMPEPCSGGCGGPEKWHMRQIRALVRSCLQSECPHIFARDGEVPPLLPPSPSPSPSLTDGSEAKRRKLADAKTSGNDENQLHNITRVAMGIRKCQPHVSEPPLKRRWWANAADRADSSMKKRLGVIVRRTHSRMLMNQAAMEEMVIGMYGSSINFEIFSDDPSPSLLETFYLFYHADVIVTPHGAAETYVMLVRGAQAVADAIWETPKHDTQWPEGFIGSSSSNVTQTPASTSTPTPILTPTKGFRNAGRNGTNGILIEIASKTWRPPIYGQIAAFLDVNYAKIWDEPVENVTGPANVMVSHEMNMTEFKMVLEKALGPGEAREA